MQFLAHYIQWPQPKSGKRLEYWRTVHGDGVNEATEQATRLTNKGFILNTVAEKEGALL